MDKKKREKLLAEITKILGSQQEQVVQDVRTAVRKHIENKSPKECLGLVLRNRKDAIVTRLPLTLDSRYAKALIAFVRKSEFESYRVDSALTDSTGAVVADAFSKRINKKADVIVKKAMPYLVSDEKFAGALSAAIVSAYTGPIPRNLQAKVVALLTSKITAALSQTIDTTTSATIKASISKVAVASISSPLAIKISAAIISTLAVALKPIIIKLLASTAFKAVLMTKLRAIVVGAMLGAFVKIVGVKLGLTASAAFMWLLVPIVLAWLAYEVVHFPAKLAGKVSDSIAEDLGRAFPETTSLMATSMTDRLIADAATFAAQQLINESLIADLLAESIAQTA